MFSRCPREHCDIFPPTCDTSLASRGRGVGKMSIPWPCDRDRVTGVSASRHTFCKGPRLRKINPPTHSTHRTHRPWPCDRVTVAGRVGCIIIQSKMRHPRWHRGWVGGSLTMGDDTRWNPTKCDGHFTLIACGYKHGFVRTGFMHECMYLCMYVWSKYVLHAYLLHCMCIFTRIYECMLTSSVCMYTCMNIHMHV